MKHTQTSIIGLSALAVALSFAHAETLFTPGDTIFAVDGVGRSHSDYPVAGDPVEGEEVENILDEMSDTKYLNFGKEQSGFIITPASGSSVIQSLIFVSANDHEERDPVTFTLYGTDDDIISEDFSRGNLENWEQIATGNTELPTDRFATSPAVEITNSTAYTSYRIVFETLRNQNANGDDVNPNSMQIADINFYDQPAAAGSNILAVGDPIITIDLNRLVAESPNRILDGDPDTKYLNFGDNNSGFIITPGSGSSIVKSFSLVTANDVPERDPSSYILYGTNEAIVSADNSFGNGEEWTQISAGTLDLPVDRFTLAPIIEVDNAVGYTSYRLIFDTIKNSDEENGGSSAMQVADVQFYTEAAGAGTEIFAGNDPILAVDFDAVSRSNQHEVEIASNAIDGTLDKYLNHAGAGTGFVITPSVGASVVNSFTITTANDVVGRDPLTYIISGTNETLDIEDDAFVGEEGWELIQTGSLTLTDDREVIGDAVAVTNGSSYTSYRVIFDSVKEDGLRMQIAEIQFDGIVGTGEITISEIGHLSNTDTTTLVWNSAPGQNYSLFFSTDLVEWEEENDSITSGGSTTTYIPTNPLVDGLEKVFYRVIAN